LTSLPCIRSNTRNVTDLPLRGMRLSDKTIWIHRPINYTSNMKSSFPAFIPSSFEMVSGFSASGVAPAYNFVESLTVTFLAGRWGKRRASGRGRMYEYSTSKKVQFAMQKSRVLSLLLAMLGDLSVGTRWGSCTACAA
jgi:hypothetical protein